MSDRKDAGPSKTAAALFDLRTVIAVLFGVYGVVLTIVGATASPADYEQKTGGIDINLWTGIGMLVVAAIFVLWVRLSPPLTDPPPADSDADRPPAH